MTVREHQQHASRLGLLERDSVLQVLCERLAAAATGRGAVVLVEGPSGIGKTELLHAAQTVARHRGMDVIAAAGGELERSFSYGVVRQLFEPVLRRAGARRERLMAGSAATTTTLFSEGTAAPAAAQEPGVMIHGLFWLAANLAEESGLLVVIDDAHWVDLPSLRWLVYLARRIADLPILVAVGARSDEPGAATLRALADDPATERLELPPMSPAATRTLLGAALCDDPSPALTDACHGATRGNPFLLAEVVRTLISQGAASDGVKASPTAISELTPERVARFARRRLERLGRDAASLAQAVAVLGDDALLRDASAVAGLDRAAAVGAADLLVGAQILSPAPFRFVHPLIRTAVYAEMAPAVRAEAHRTAAHVLARAGADNARVASHILQTDPTGEADHVLLLKAAATEALAAGAPAMASLYLRRALAEPPPGHLQAGLVHSLGNAALLAREPDAVAYLQRALHNAEDVRDRARIALDLGRGMIGQGRLAEADAALRDGAAGLGPEDDSLRARLELHRVAIQVWTGTRVQPQQRETALLRLAQRDEGRPLASALAFRDVVDGAPPAAVLRLVEHGIGDGQWISSPQADGLAATLAIRTLTVLDKLDLADHVLDRMMAAAAGRGSAMNFAAACAWRAGVALRRGRVRCAEEEARRSVQLADERGLVMIAPYARASLAEALLELDAPDEALETLLAMGAPSMTGTLPEAVVLLVRARVRRRLGRLAEALSDLQTCAQLVDRLGISNPNMLPWRSDLALALPAAEREQRSELVELELAAARAAGLPRGIGVALRARALVCADRRQTPELLGEAVSVLRQCPSHLEVARTQLELGASLRRLGLRRDARVPLQEAMESAHRLHAIGVCDRARSELVACGARPRRMARTGLDGLTPAELRVSTLAADGLGNREIAELLFVSLRTVTTHLSHAYQKLGITSREELGRALAARPEEHGLTLVQPADSC